MINALRFLIVVTFLLAISTGLLAQAQHDSLRKSVDLNEFVVRKSSVMKAAKHRRLRTTSLIVRPEPVSTQHSWDSILLLTRFPAPSRKPMVLHAISGQLAELDTSKLELDLVIIQLRETDTVFRRIRLTPAMLDAGEKRFEIDLRDSMITLDPAPFYLGFGFRTKPLSDEYHFPFFYTHGGEGAVLSFPKGQWIFVSHPHSIYIFPFQLTYVEAGA